MTKQEFLTALRARLSALPIADMEERLDFYTESIDDRIEDGLAEEDAVQAVGTVDDVAAQILAEIPLSKIVKEKARPKRRLKTWETILLWIGCPIWLSLAVSALAVLFSLYVALWSVVLSLWATFGALGGSALGSLLGGIGLAIGGHSFTGLTLLSAGLVCAGLAILLFFGCKAATKGTANLTQKIVLSIKLAFIGKETKK